MSLWVGINILRIFWWCGQNILKISLCHIRMMWKIFFHMYMDENWTSMNVLDDNYKLMKNLDEKFDSLSVLMQLNKSCN